MTTTVSTVPAASATISEALRTEPTVQAFALLRTGFTAAPVLFGIDKFFNVMTNWSTYLAPQFDRIIPGNAHQAMLAVGVIGIVAGIVVALRPRIGAYVVAAWL